MWQEHQTVPQSLQKHQTEMLYIRYKLFKPFSAGTDFKRQNLTAVDVSQIPTFKRFSPHWKN